jgi:hypothetical protein
VKKLFFALLVFNLVFWLWGKRQELVPEPLSIEPGVGVIRLLDADDLAARREAAAGQAIGPAGATATSGEPARGLPPPADIDAPVVAEVHATAELPATSDVMAAAEEPAEPMAETLPPAAPVRPSLERTDASDPVAPAGVESSPADLPPDAVEMPPAPVAVEPVPRIEAPTATASRVEAPDDAFVCESVGPFRDRASAERYAATMPTPLLRSGVREEVVARAARYWVVAPAARDADPAYRQALADAGVHDAWRVKTGTLAGRLSLGSFLVEDNARKQIALLGAKGVAAELLPVREQERRWWADYERPQTAPPPARPSAGGEPAKQIVGRRCSRVAGP